MHRPAFGEALNLVSRNWIAFVHDGALFRVRPSGKDRRRLMRSDCTAVTWSLGRHALAVARDDGAIVAMSADESPGADARI